MKKKVLIVERSGGASLAEVIGLVCNCEAESSVDCVEAREKVSRLAYDFIILDPFILDKDFFISWLDELKPLRKQGACQVILLSSFSLKEIDDNYPLIAGLHYDHFLYNNIWEKMKAIISN